MSGGPGGQVRAAGNEELQRARTEPMSIDYDTYEEEGESTRSSQPVNSNRLRTAKSTARRRSRTKKAGGASAPGGVRQRRNKHWSW
jgi:hypothetical protein